jgi:predicted dehydrogenase
MNDTAPSRRDFLGTAGVAATGLTLASLTAAASARAAGSNERLSVGIVGPGGRGTSLLKNFFDVNKECKAELAAVCDLWSRNRERATERVKKDGGQEPRQFSRLEDMLNDKGIDAVIIATSDHAHAQQLALCLQAGKNVYCEKPFANVLEEANATIDAYRKSDKVVTLGTQRRSDPQFMAAADLVRTGVLGDLVQAVYVDNTLSPYRWRRDKDVQAIRGKDTDWKAFLMGRPDQPFDPRKYLEFRLFHDFSTGIIDQWMTHKIDAIHMLTGAKFPRSVVAHGGTYAWKDHRENGDTVQVVLDYPQGFQAIYSATLASGFGKAAYVLGRKGTLEVELNWRYSDDIKGGKAANTRPIERKEGYAGTMDQIHMRDWLTCVHKGQRETHCTAEHGYQHAVACIMADRALHSGRRMVFDEGSRTIREG